MDKYHFIYIINGIALSVCSDICGYTILHWEMLCLSTVCGSFKSLIFLPDILVDNFKGNDCLYTTLYIQNITLYLCIVAETWYYVKICGIFCWNVSNVKHFCTFWLMLYTPGQSWGPWRPTVIGDQSLTCNCCVDVLEISLYLYWFPYLWLHILPWAAIMLQLEIGHPVFDRIELTLYHKWIQQNVV